MNGNEIYSITEEEAGNERNFRTGLGQSNNKIENIGFCEEIKFEGYSSSSSSFQEEEYEKLFAVKDSGH